MGLTTDDILRLPPFNLTDEIEFAAFKNLLKDLNLTTDKFFWGEVYKPKDCEKAEDKLPYTDEQLAIFAADMVPLYNRLFMGKIHSSETKVYEFTCGAPLVGKTTFMKRRVVDSSKVFLDIESEILPHMQSYKDFVLKTGDQKAAYEFLRDVSNYYCVLFLTWGLYKGYNIAHCGVATDSRVVESILPTIKKLGYNIKADVIFAPRESRILCGEYRKTHQNYYRSTPSEEVGRVAKVFAIFPEIMQLADAVDFYWNFGKFWLSTTPEQSGACYRNFASFDRAKDSENVVGDPTCADILPMLTAEIEREIPELAKQRELINLFAGWLVKPEQKTVLLFSNTAAQAAPITNVSPAVFAKPENKKG